LTHSEEIDFTVAAHFTAVFAEKLLRVGPIRDVDVLKIDVPADATPETEWQVTRLSRAKYYIPVSPRRTRLDEPGSVGYEIVPNLEGLEPDSDVYVLRVARKVTVTPLSLDMTSRLDLAELERKLGS
jgi:5'-nucleotidase